MELDALQQPGERGLQLERRERKADAPPVPAAKRHEGVREGIGLPPFGPERLGVGPQVLEPLRDPRRVQDQRALADPVALELDVVGAPAPADESPGGQSRRLSCTTPWRYDIDCNASAVMAPLPMTSSTSAFALSHTPGSARRACTAHANAPLVVW